MIVNCAHSKGIGFVRNEIKSFAQTAIIHVPFKSVVLLNADHLSADAQSALRRCMEQFSHTTRFFGVVIDKDRLICPILSRFSVVRSGADSTEVVRPSEDIQVKATMKAQAYPQKVADEIMTSIRPETTDVQLMSLVDDMYNAGVTSFTLVNWIRTNSQTGYTTDLCLTVESERQNYRNDQLFLLRVAGLYRETLG